MAAITTADRPTSVAAYHLTLFMMLVTRLLSPEMLPVDGITPSS